jgi:lipoprotein-releasing system ATP-binding protein
MLKARQIVKAYPKLSLLNSIDLTLEKGQSIAICGRSGEGKTTLLHILGTLEAPDSGLLEIGGELITRSNAPFIRNQQIGFIFQAYNLLEDFTTLENVLMPARIARRPISRQKGLDLLSQVDLLNRADYPAKLLSGGERQRAAIARALCNNPSIILADEPTGNLDRGNAKLISDLLISLKKSLIIVTHDAELANLCDQQYLLKEGTLTKVGEAEPVFPSGS